MNPPETLASPLFLSLTCTSRDNDGNDDDNDNACNVKSLGSPAFAGLFKDALCVLHGYHVFITATQTWAEAKEYCRKYYTDLSSINSMEEDEELSKYLGEGRSASAWIGLYKDADDIWKWSGGENAEFFNWPKQRNSSEDNRCVVKDKRGWLETHCETVKYYSYCFKSNLVLVKENKTWEEALSHCRDQFTDLVSMPSHSVLHQTLRTSKEAQTDYVWTGLRYLADVWLWVDGQSLDNQAWNKGETPWCPAQRHRCGALSLEGRHWHSWDCVEKLNFPIHVRCNGSLTGPTGLEAATACAAAVKAERVQSASTGAERRRYRYRGGDYMEEGDGRTEEQEEASGLGINTQPHLDQKRDWMPEADPGEDTRFLMEVRSEFPQQRFPERGWTGRMDRHVTTMFLFITNRIGTHRSAVENQQVLSDLRL
ncbi:hypothetical protein L3Q82_007569 [Scortum barcoo]|uniref:Uncharacterized protein n=1 Tax=Scortum barcoo TaxID=214431 RepID=A0ACB8WNA5_9TELE|nr:hypothetical protein L3Q82_007569 [Scortum barcoo]